MCGFLSKGDSGLRMFVSMRRSIKAMEKNLIRIMNGNLKRLTETLNEKMG